MVTQRLRSLWPVAVYDRLYRVWHGLDRSAAAVPPALRVETRRSYRAIHLADRTLVERGEWIGVLHLDNTRMVAIHARERSPMAVGLAFRRLLVESLESLAAAACPGGRLGDVSAFAAVTIFQHGLRRLGFEAEPDGLFWPRVTAVYQRALLASLHPHGIRRVDRVIFEPATRMWISRDRLLGLYRPGGRALVIGKVATLSVAASLLVKPGGEVRQ